MFFWISRVQRQFPLKNHFNGKPKFFSFCPWKNARKVENFSTKLWGKRHASSGKIVLKNDKIPHNTVQLILENGKNNGAMSLETALKSFNLKEFDLVLVNDAQSPPICKLISKKQQFDKKKKPKPAALKELEINSKIGDGDLTVKLKQSKTFLLKGNNVKFTIKKNGERDANEMAEFIKSELASHGTAQKTVAAGRLLIFMVKATAKRQ